MLKVKKLLNEIPEYIFKNTPGDIDFHKYYEEIKRNNDFQEKIQDFIDGLAAKFPHLAKQAGLITREDMNRWITRTGSEYAKIDEVADDPIIVNVN